MKYKHLNQNERESIGQMKFAEYSLTKIAKLLQRAPSTISRELMFLGLLEESTNRAFANIVRIRASPAGEVADDELLAVAASLETNSEHPLARAIVKKAKERNLDLAETNDFISHTGGGVSGIVGNNRIEIGKPGFIAERISETPETLRQRSDALQREAKTVVWVARDGKWIGLIAISDAIKETTPAAVASLHRRGIRLLMATGDNEATAKAVGKELGIDEIHAGLSPEDKIELVKRLKAEGHVVAMAGDGINDAPALAEADVGIAMGTGTDVAIESASVTLVKGDLNGIANAVVVGRTVMRNIRQNLVFAFGYNALGVPIAAGILYPFFGILLSPMIAGAAMSFSSVSVIANSLRLRLRRLKISYQQP